MNNEYTMMTARIVTAIYWLSDNSVVVDRIVGGVRADAITDDAIGDRVVGEGVME